MWTHTEAHPGEFLRVHFLEPLGLSAADLARGCRIPRSRVSDLLSGKRSITADTAMRLAAFFRMEPEAFMALQADWDLHQTHLDDAIVPLDPPGFVLGPMGATRIPRKQRPRPPQLRAPVKAARPSEAPRVEHEEVRYADGTRALVAKTP